MSVLWGLAWGTAGEETRQEMVELARQAESLLTALGAPSSPSPSAYAFGADATGQTVSDWVDAYERVATAVGGIPVSVLWAGQHWADPRSDAIVMRLSQGSPPSWDTIVQRATALHPPSGNRNTILGLMDWWAARGPQLQRGNEPQQAADRYARAWWAEKISRWHTTPQGTTPPGATPPTPQREGEGGSGVVWLVAALAAAWAIGRRRRR